MALPAATVVSRSGVTVAPKPCHRISAVSITMIAPTIVAIGTKRLKSRRSTSMLMSSIITTNRNSTITAPT